MFDRLHLLVNFKCFHWMLVFSASPPGRAVPHSFFHVYSDTWVALRKSKWSTRDSEACRCSLGELSTCFSSLEDVWHCFVPERKAKKSSRNHPLFLLEWHSFQKTTSRAHSLCAVCSGWSGWFSASLLSHVMLNLKCHSSVPWGWL